MPAATEIESQVAQLGSLFSARRRAAANALAAAGPAACGPLLAVAIMNRSIFESAEGVDLLRRLEYPEAVDLLAGIVALPGPAANPVAGEMLVRIGGDRVVVALIRLLRVRFAESRATAARALGILGDRSAVGPLCQLLTARESFWRRRRPLPEVPEALGRIGDPRAVPFLLEPELPFHDLRERALIRIGRAGSHALAEALHPERRKDAFLAMRILHHLGPDALPSLASLKASGSSYARNRAVVLEALLLPPDPDRVPVLMTAFSDPSEGIAGLAAHAVARLARGGFGHLLQPAQLRALRARKWGNPSVRAACRLALEAIEEQGISPLGSLPLPAARGSADAHHLPLPTRDRTGLGHEFPLPSGEALRQ